MLICKYSLPPFSLLSLSLLALPIASEAAPIYSVHYCRSSFVFQPNSTFRSNLNLLLSSLTSNASLPSGFYRTTLAQYTPDPVAVLFVCRGDINATVCQGCVVAAAKDIVRRCPNQTEAIMWYDVCVSRYSNRSMAILVSSTELKDDKDITASKLDLFNQSLANLLSYGWKLWKGGTPLELLDPTIRESYTANEVMRCIHIGLLCVQEDPADRPTMASIVLMLDRYSVTLPTPSQPVFFLTDGRNHVSVIPGFVIPVVESIVLFIFGFCSSAGKQARDMMLLWRNTNS